MRRLWRLLTSIKVTAVLMALLAALFLLNVALPQARIVGAAGIAELAAQSRFYHFVFVTLGFGDMPSSPIFLVTIVLFFVNLVAVLIDRGAATAKRIRAKVPSEVALRRRAGGADSLSLPRPAGWTPERAQELLRRLGYRVSRPGEHTLFAEKNRLALLGFIVFHLSFFPILAGGVLLYYTRYESVVVAIEGSTFNPAEGRVLRNGAWADVPDLSYRLEQVEPRFIEGKQEQLVATLSWQVGSDREQQVAMINQPVRRGDVDVLVEQVGLAPALRLLDAEGRTLQLIAMPAPTLESNIELVPIGDYALEVAIGPRMIDSEFASREQLQTVEIALSAWRRGEAVFQGSLRPGEFARAGEYTLKLEEVRYWARFRIVAERGGWLLIFGFVFGVFGIVWRMLFIRQEVGVVWTEDEIKLFGRAEFYRGQFHDGLQALGDLLIEAPATEPRSES